MKTIIFKVECSCESKTFHNEIEAFAYFKQMKTERNVVELWHFIVESTPRVFCVSRELLAYSP